MVGAHGVDSNAAVRKVNETLQGPIADLLSQFVPELKKLPAGHAYEKTLDDIGLLQRCFEAFRAQRDLFKTVLVDADKQPVTDDRAVLSCGRTLDQVVAMIVRTAAKRYFRRKFNASGHRPLAGTQLRDGVTGKGFAHRVASIFHEEPKPVPTHKAEPQRSRADELYDAIKEHLLHEWQVPLVPTYADMAPKMVRALGPKLLDIRTQEDLQRIADDPAEAAKLFDIPGEISAQADAASAGTRDERARLSNVLTGDGKRLRAEAFTDILLRPEVRAQLGSAAHGLRLTETLRGVGGLSTKLLVAELGLRLDQLAVFLLVAHQAIGPNLFGRVFGMPGEVELVMRITQKARLAGLSQKSSLLDVSTFVQQAFATKPR
ncbi:MAG: hypothetical protein H7Z12_04570 [Rhodospirillaceae bacterium]|nr:hypothetical protein [Rhodospirillales bacterium]